MAMWQFKEEDVIEDVRKAAGGAVPSKWACPCGCGNVVVYARDDRALWLANTLVADDDDCNAEKRTGSLRILGLQGAADLAMFAEAMRQCATERGAPVEYVDQLVAVLEQHLPEGDRDGRAKQIMEGYEAAKAGMSLGELLEKHGMPKRTEACRKCGAPPERTWRDKQPDVQCCDICGAPLRVPPPQRHLVSVEVSPWGTEEAGPWMVTLDCGHQMATNKKMVSYPCLECACQASRAEVVHA